MPDYKNRFRSPEYLEETIVREEDGTVVGTVRIKPSSIQWKPRNAQKFFSVSIDKFSEWITADATGARRTKS